MKIILGVDDSRHSHAAIEMVAKTPWPKDTRVIVLSASPRFFAGPGEAVSPGVVEQLVEEQIAYHHGIAKRAEEQLRAAGMKAESRVAQGDPREALVETARAEGAELIVVGSHGRTGLAKILIGSVASHVVAHAPCNVLVVKLPTP